MQIQQKFSFTAVSSFSLKMLFAALLFLYTSVDSSAQKAQFVAFSNDHLKKEQRAEVPRTLARKFKRDAARLALRLEEKKEDLRYQNIIIPQDNIESIYYVLTNIYQVNETAQSIAKCNVHTFPNPSIDHIILIFDREIDWAAPLRDGISETESDEFNDLLDEYDLIIERHVQWNDTEDAITIRSKSPLNMSALANEFYNIEGINSIDLGVPKIGGNDIVINRIDGGWRVEYVLRFGSYINGKGKMHIWKYEALDNGDIFFLEEDGDPVPEWMRCHFVGENMVSKG